METPVLWHNPKCSKSRQAVALLKNKGIQFHEVRYMDVAPSIAELEAYLAIVGQPAVEIMRKKEPLFRELSLDLSDEKALIQAMHQFPRLIERPVLFANGKAVIGRPTEALLEIL